MSWVFLAIPLGALTSIWPIPGLALTILAVLVIAAADRKGPKGNVGAADLLVAPFVLLRRAFQPFFTALIKPFKLIRALILVVLAMVVAGAVAAGLAWLGAPDAEDNEGWVTAAAVRMGVWSNGPRYLAALLAVLVWLSVSKKSALRLRLDTSVKRMSENQLTAASVAVVVLSLGFALLLTPSSWAPFGSASQFVRDTPIPGVEKAALEIGQSEAEQVLQCYADNLYDDLGGLYSAAVTASAIGDRLEVSFSKPDDMRLTLEQRTAIVMSLHNQLPTWIDQLRVTVGSRDLVLSRTDLGHTEPILSPDDLEGRLSRVPEAGSFDDDLRHAVAECSVAAP
ncbi:hypothetical protein [Nocardioides plantarum]|uniref:Uncharacterized protein n=1 Tax=Nocardioides plantarum TaxID=29299 RepID=A0ABV5KEJ1_9ACTN|nr:hypothetical protein [Nocardioides plantarum]